MKIGDLEFKNGIFLAPMAGVADRSFRLICRKYGAEGVYTEMISAKAVTFGDKKTKKLAECADDERPIFIQLFGSDPVIMARAAESVLKYGPCGIDINMGCPVRKIVSNGEGSALMQDEKKAEMIVREVKCAVGKDIPVTVKMRLGFDKAHINAPRLAYLCENAGASAVCVHARTREDMYSPGVDLDTLALVKRAVSIPVIGNGDIFSKNDAERMLDATDCDGIAVARGALGNPWIFADIATLFGKERESVTDEVKFADIKEHFSNIVREKGEYTAVCEARKHASWYIAGRRNSASLRNTINSQTSIEGILDSVFTAFFG